jgi:hypothetical protein
MEIVPTGPQEYLKTVTDAMTIVQSPGREIPTSVVDTLSMLSGTDVPPQGVVDTLSIVDNVFDILEIFPGYPFVDDVMNIQQTVVEQKVGEQKESISQPCGVNHTVSYCFGAPWSAISVTHALGLTSQVNKGTSVAVVDAMSIQCRSGKVTVSRTPWRSCKRSPAKASSVGPSPTLVW